MLERGEIRHRRATAVVAGLPRDIGDRELAVVAEQLDWPAECLQFRHLPSGHGQGNVLLIEIAGEAVTEVFTGFGQRGVPAETVAAGVVAQARDYLAAEVPVGPYLADQLLLPLALAGGGSLATMPLSPHAQTNIAIIEQFLDVRFSTREIRPGAWRIDAGRG